MHRRRVLREKDEAARRIGREHKTGVRRATDDELAAARAVIRETDERNAKAARARESVPAAGGESGGEQIVTLSLLDADVEIALRAYAMWAREKVEGPPDILQRRTSIAFEEIAKPEGLLAVERALHEQARVEIFCREACTSNR